MKLAAELRQRLDAGCEHPEPRFALGAQGVRPRPAPSRLSVEGTGTSRQMQRTRPCALLWRQISTVLLKQRRNFGSSEIRSARVRTARICDTECALQRPLARSCSMNEHTVYYQPTRVQTSLLHCLPY